MLLSLLLVAGQARATIDHHVNRQLTEVSSEVASTGAGANASKYSKSSRSDGLKLQGFCGFMEYVVTAWEFYEPEYRRISRAGFITGCSRNLGAAGGEGCGETFDAIDEYGSEYIFLSDACDGEDVPFQYVPVFAHATASYLAAYKNIPRFLVDETAVSVAIRAFEEVYYISEMEGRALGVIQVLFCDEQIRQLVVPLQEALTIYGLVVAISKSFDTIVVMIPYMWVP